LMPFDLRLLLFGLGLRVKGCYRWKGLICCVSRHMRRRFQWISPQRLMQKSLKIKFKSSWVSGLKLSEVEKKRKKPLSSAKKRTLRQQLGRWFRLVGCWMVGWWDGSSDSLAIILKCAEKREARSQKSKRKYRRRTSVRLLGFCPDFRGLYMSLSLSLSPTLSLWNKELLKCFMVLETRQQLEKIMATRLDEATKNSNWNSSSNSNSVLCW